MSVVFQIRFTQSILVKSNVATFGCRKWAELNEWILWKKYFVEVSKLARRFTNATYYYLSGDDYIEFFFYKWSSVSKVEWPSPNIHSNVGYRLNSCYKTKLEKVELGGNYRTLHNTNMSFGSFERAPSNIRMFNNVNFSVTLLVLIITLDLCISEG